mmetsp:Transcript_13795/g.19770  ORF Transcript_13795/g.19770 Transcript_13795/m.19770 type:complete len:120 (+) Transcript_13795:135-494(+)
MYHKKEGNERSNNELLLDFPKSLSASLSLFSSPSKELAILSLTSTSNDIGQSLQIKKEKSNLIEFFLPPFNCSHVQYESSTSPLQDSYDRNHHFDPDELVVAQGRFKQSMAPSDFVEKR